MKYGCQLPALVKAWRSNWHAGSGGETAADFPFGVVQLSAVTVANSANSSIACTQIRWYQTQQLGSLPNPLMKNTFMATTYDLGDATSPYGSVHTRYKTEVGERLSLAGRRVAYGEDVYTGPVFANITAKSCGASPGGGSSYSITLGFRDPGKSGLEIRPMTISKTFDQGGWTGSSAFEVCTGGDDGAPPSVKGSCEPGALPAGSDLRVANMTLDEAVAWCDGARACGGFTTATATPGPHPAGVCNVTGILKIYFKRAMSGVKPNIDTSWVSFVKPVPVCSVLSEYTGWALAGKVELGDTAGTSITLTGAAAGCPTAVRFAWRAYPCEHLGCGLYSKDEGLPPPPFYTATAAVAATLLPGNATAITTTVPHDSPALRRLRSGGAGGVAAAWMTSKDGPGAFSCIAVDSSKLSSFCRGVPAAKVCDTGGGAAFPYDRDEATFEKQLKECSTPERRRKMCPNEPSRCAVLNQTQYCGGSDQHCVSTRECLQFCYSDCYPCNDKSDCDTLVAFGVVAQPGGKCWSLYNGTETHVPRREAAQPMR